MCRFLLSLILLSWSFLVLAENKATVLANYAAPAPPDVDLGPDQNICEGDTLILDATVTDAGATYLWQDGSTAPTFSVTQAGMYSVTVTAAGESAADTVQVTVSDLPDLDLGRDTTLCLGDSLVFDLSDLGVQVLWPDGSRGDRYVVYSTTRVGVEYRTQDGCSVADVVQATFVTPPPVDLGDDVEICEGEDVTLDATVPGNVITYVWNDGNTQPERSISQSGIYAVTASDRGCARSDTVAVTINDAPMIDIGPADTTVCGGDPLVLEVANPTGTVLWSDGTTGPTNTITSSGQVWARLTENGCSAADTIDVQIIPLPPVDIGPAQQQICDGETATFDATVSGSVSYLWQDGSTQPSFSTVQSGTYSVTVTDRGCSAEDEVNLLVNPLPLVDLGPADTLLCGGTELQLELANTGGTITWPDGSSGNTYTVTTAGTVTVEVTENNCTAQDFINVDFAPLPPVDLGPASQSICEGESTTLDAQVPDGGTYLWEDGSTQPVRTVSQSGLYQVTVTADGCSAEDEVQLTVNELPTVDLGGPDTLLCGGTTLSFDLTGTAGTITWPDGSTGPTYSVNTSGLVQVQVTENGCSATDAINVTFSALPPVDIGPATREICEGDDATLDATVPGTATYAWEDGSSSPIRTVAQTGSYSVTVTGPDGCSAEDELQLVVNPLPAVDLGGSDTLVCDEQSLTFDLSAISGGTFTWSDGSTGPTFTATMSGVVQVEVSQNNCTATDAIQVDFGTSPSLDLGPPSVSLCQDEPYVLETQDPNATYLWSDGSNKNSLEVTQSGTYWVVANNNGCTASDTIMVELTPIPTTNLDGSIDACEGSPVTLDAGNPGADIEWQDGTTGPLFTVRESGTYWVEINIGACNVRDTVSINFRTTPEVEFETTDVSACIGETVTLEPFVSMADELRWQDGSTGFSLQVNSAGIYWLEAEIDGCTDRDSIRVFFQNPPLLDLGEDRTVCDNQVTILRAGTSEDVVRWSTGFTGTSLRVESPGTYWASVDDGVCTATDTVEIAFLPCGTENIYIPTAFSPNQDDVNEDFRPFFNPTYQIMDYELSIFNRWGGLLFQTSNPEEAWDGTFNGQQVQEGVYVYMIKVKFADGAGEQDEVVTGDVTVVR